MSDKPVPEDLRSLKGHPDLGIRSAALPETLRSLYFVDSHYDDEVADLVRDSPGREALLVSVAPVLHGLFGCDARLTLAALWNLSEPVRPVLHVLIYTKLSRQAAGEANRKFVREWLSLEKPVDLVFVPQPLR
jgi:hypothetical protein